MKKPDKEPPKKPIWYYRGVERWLETLRMFRKALFSVSVLISAAIATLIFIALTQDDSQSNASAAATGEVPAAIVGTSFDYTFNDTNTLEEAGSEKETKSPYWWLDSGGKLLSNKGVGETVQGALPQNDPWHKEYANTNSADTDGGIHPQNLFRLVSRSAWDNVRVESSFRIKKDNLSASSNRNESNGLLLMSRYQDNGQTLYYAGIRVDGTAVIKKKYRGEYYTMAQNPVFTGTYDHANAPNLLPKDTWIRLRSETLTNNDGSVSVKLYMENMDSSEWKLLLSADDHSQYGKTPPITGPSEVGLRTDFMDVQFDDIHIEKL